MQGIAMSLADDLAAYALSKPGAWPDQPWEAHTVAKVHDKIFCFLRDTGIGVKCGGGRDEADHWLAQYPEGATVMPYIGRSGWNDLAVEEDIPDDDLFDAIDDSYRMVVERLPKKHRPDGWDA